MRRTVFLFAEGAKQIDVLKTLRAVDQNRPVVATSLDDASLSHSAQQFVLWALATLKVGCEQQKGTSTYRLSVPEQSRAALGAETVAFCFAADGIGAQPEAECLSCDSRLFRWLIDQLRHLDGIQHAAPTEQPVGVHQIAQQIFAAYEVKRGTAHLSGCTLDDRSFLRVTYLTPDRDSPDPVQQRFFDAEGGEVDEHLVAALGLEQLKPAAVVPRLPTYELQQWLAVAESQESRATAGEGIVSTLIWCKHAQVKMSFAIGESTAEQSFSGWAQQLGDGTQKPPPFRCPVTALESYCLDLTDDGRVTVSEAVALCEETGRRVLVTELETCSVTGKQVCADALDVCPVTMELVLRSALDRCSMCDQLVSPTSLKNGRCSACTGLKPVSKDDPRMARVLGEYPKLDRWGRWRLAETARAYILMASAMIKRLLVVVEKESLEPQRVAISSRFSAQWSDAPLAERDHYLRNAS